MTCTFAALFSTLPEMHPEDTQITPEGVLPIDAASVMPTETPALHARGIGRGRGRGRGQGRDSQATAARANSMFFYV
jgi:hypothetical protein